MKAAQVRELTTEELVETLADKEMKLAKLKINHKISDVENPIEIRRERRNIARIKTELRSREIQANN